MTPITRAPEPPVLAENKTDWTAKYLVEHAKNPRKRPHHAQYAHPRIIETLEGMSAHKCFYCEQSTKQTKKTVDHHVEVTERPEDAFAWPNLYLACIDCNVGKPDNRSIPVVECLDPCAPAVAPHEHLTFDAEAIRARDDSALGRRTIQKYRLDRPDLDRMRAKMLIRFLEEVSEIQSAMRREERAVPSAVERERLRAFGQRDQPFSLMFSVYLDRISDKIGL